MNYAITMKDGSVAIMQTIGDHIDPLDCIAKWHPQSQKEVVSIKPVTQDEAVKIREARPKRDKTPTLEERLIALESKLNAIHTS